MCNLEILVIHYAISRPLFCLNGAKNNKITHAMNSFTMHIDLEGKQFSCYVQCLKASDEEQLYLVNFCDTYLINIFGGKQVAFSLNRKSQVLSRLNDEGNIAIGSDLKDNLWRTIKSLAA